MPAGGRDRRCRRSTRPSRAPSPNCSSITRSREPRGHAERVRRSAAACASPAGWSPTSSSPRVVTFEPVAPGDRRADRPGFPARRREALCRPRRAEIFVDLEGDELPDHFEGTRPISPTSSSKRWRWPSIPIPARRARQPRIRWASMPATRTISPSPPSKRSRKSDQVDA